MVLSKRHPTSPIIAVIAAVVMLTLIPQAAQAEHDIFDFDGLTVVYINLETKGDSTLVMFPNGKVMLIDGGMPDAYPNVKAILDEFGIDKIDVMVATHPDQDHVAGLNAVLNDPDFTVDRILIGPTSKDTRTYTTFLGLAGDAEIAYAGDVIDIDPDVSVQVLSPPEYLISGSSKASLENTNSVILLVTYGDIEFLFTADATYLTEEWLLDNHVDILDIDIMNAPHHGSKYGSTDQFILATSPEAVIFSVNYGNQYGHPHNESLIRYMTQDVPFAQTADGNIVFQTDGTDCSVVTIELPDLEFPCFDGVQTVPEFGGAMLVMGMTAAAVILMWRLAGREGGVFDWRPAV